MTEPPTINGRLRPHLDFDLSAIAPTIGAIIMPDKGLELNAVISVDAISCTETFPGEYGENTPSHPYECCFTLGQTEIKKVWRAIFSDQSVLLLDISWFLLCSCVFIRTCHLNAPRKSAAR